MTTEKETTKAFENAFAEFTRAWFAGERPDPEAFSRQYPEIEERLLEEIKGFLYVAKNLPEFRELDETGSTTFPPMNNTRWSSPDAEGMLSDFRIIDELGRGGMGTVYEAEQTSLSRRVALKILPPHMSFSDRAIKKFRREAEAGGRQSHPGIVAVYAVGEENGIHYIAQEPVEGGRTLAHWIESYREGKTIERGFFREAAKCISAVADALHHAHTAHVIHRDIKPSNILLTPDGQPKVTDFGLAKVEDALALSRSNEFAGTPFYMSPEQVARHRMEIDHRTDIYSLGVTLYEMLTLARPFDGETSQQVMKKILLDEPKDPRTLNPRVPKDLAVICLKCMEKTPIDRYNDMAELKDDIDRYLAGETIKARPAGFITRTGKRFRRNPVVSIALLLIVAATIIVPTVIISKEKQVIEAVESRDKAEVARQAALDAIYALKLARFSASALTHDPALALLLGYKADSIHSDHFTNDALLDALEACLEVKTLFHTSKVFHATFNPDSQFVATSSRDHRIRIWDWNAGETVNTLDGHTSDIHEINYNSSGSRFVSASSDHTARIWDADTGKSVLTLEHAGPVLSAAFSHDDRWIVTASSDLTAQVWDAQTGEKKFDPLHGHQWFAHTARFGPTDDHIMTASEDGFIRLWDWREGTLLHKRRIGENGARLLCADLKADDGSDSIRFLVAGTTSGKTWFWDLQNDDPAKMIARQNGAILDVAFRPNRDHVLTATSMGAASILDIHSGDILFELKGNQDLVTSSRFDAGGNKVVSASLDRTTRIFDLINTANLTLIEQSESGNTYTQFTDSSRYLGQANENRTLIDFWNVAAQKKISTINVCEPWSQEACEKQFTGDEYRLSPDRKLLYVSESDNSGVNCEREWVKRMIISPNGQWLLTVLTTSHPRIWDTTTGKEAYWFHHSGDLQSAAFSPDGSRLAVGLTGCELIVFDTATWEIDAERKLDSWAESIVYSEAGNRICVLKKNGQVDMFGPRLDQLYSAPEFSGSLSISTVKFGRHEHELITVVDDGTVRIWNSGKEKTIIGERLEIFISASLIPQTDRIFTLADSGIMQIWQADTGEFLNSIRGRENRSLRYTVSPDGLQLAAALKTGFIRYWSLEETPLLQRDSEFPHQVDHISFDRDGDYVVLATKNGMVKVWPKNFSELAVNRLPRDFTRAELDLYGIQQSTEHPSSLENIDHYELNHDSWNKVIKPSLSMATYGQALKHINVACQLDPENKTFEITKGIALYRTGRWKEAYELFSKDALIDATDTEGGCLAAPLFSIMALLRLEKQTEAQKVYTQLRAKLSDPWEKRFPQYGFILNELLSFDAMQSIVSIPTEELESPEIEPFVFAGKTDNGWNIIRHDPADKTTKTIAELGDKRGAGFAFDSKRNLLFYLERVEKERNLSVYDFNNGEVRPATSYSFRAAGDFSCHPIGDQIYFSKGQRKEVPHGIDIFRMQVDGETLSEPVPILGAPLRTTFMPAVSPDGEWLAFIHYQGNSWSYGQELWIGHMNEEGTSPFDIQQLSSDQNPDFDCCFSPDSRYLYRFYRVNGGGSNIMKVCLDTMENRIIFSDHGEIERGVSISRSGYLAFNISRSPEDRFIQVIDPSGKSRIKLGGDDIFRDSPCFIDR